MVGPKQERGVACTSEDWEELEQFREMLLKFLTSKCRDWSEAQDLVQETLLRAARYRDKLRDRGRLRAWVMQIAANVFRDQVRRAGRVVQVPLGEDLIEQLPASEGPAGGSPSETLFQLEGALAETDQLVSCLNEVLPKQLQRDRDVLTSYYTTGEDTQLTAEACGIQKSLVKVRLFRARRRLKQSLQLEFNRRQHGDTLNRRC